MIESQKKPTAQVFKIVMSRGDSINVDGDEIVLVLDAIKKGSPCKLRQAIFNPSFYVNIVEDTERLNEWRRKNNDILKHNNQDLEYRGGEDQRTYVEMKPLKDIFVKIKLRLGDNKESKALS